MQVRDTVFTMMLRFPWSYPTRVDALLELFDSYNTQWEKGELVFQTPLDNKGSHLPFSPDKVADPENYESVSQVIAARQANAQAQFVFDNAYVLSHDKSSYFRPSKPLLFEGKRFADIPPDITPDWLEAAKELAWAVVQHKFFNDGSYGPAELERKQEQQERSVKLCQQFLEKFKVIRPCPYERAARVTKLLQEAEALGLNLTESDGSPPKTSV